MITYDFYVEKMREAITLLNVKISKETVELIYKRIKDNYQNEDFEKAIEDIIVEGELKYHKLLKSLNYYASIRREEENAKEKQKHEEEARNFWRNNQEDIKQGTCNRKCYECHVEYCALIAKETIAGIREILSKKKTAAEVLKELATKFPGAHFGEGRY